LGFVDYVLGVRFEVGGLDFHRYRVSNENPKRNHEEGGKKIKEMSPKDSFLH
jgi:hypothetical protein